MRDPAPFVLGKIAYLCGDGPELLAYSAIDGEPMWKVFCGDVIVGMGATDKLVFVLDAGGGLQTYRILDGLPMDPAEIGEDAHGLVVDPSGAWAVMQGSEVIARGPWGVRRVPLEAPGAVGFGDKGMRLAIGSQTGAFYAVDPSTGVAWGVVEVGAPVVSIGWSVLGYWVVAAGTRLYQIAADGASILGTLDLGREPTALSVSPEGLLVAWLAGLREVHIVDIDAQKRIGGVSYRHRTVGGLCFADTGVLGVGLDDGDANRFELLNGGVGRTGQHRGKAFSQWAADVDLDPGAVRGALARSYTGGELIAEQVIREEETPAGRAKSRAWSCMVSSGLGCLSLIACCGCSGVFYQVFHRFYYGY